MQKLCQTAEYICTYINYHNNIQHMSTISLIKSRKSPYAFDRVPVPFETIQTAFEAAQWAASAYNSQPWRFIYEPAGTDGFEQLKSFAIPFNQNWLEHAGGIGVIMARVISEHNGEPDGSAVYCTGLAMGQFSVELTSLGYELHQLSAFDQERLKADLGLPEAFEPIAMMGIGKGKIDENTPADLAEMEAGRVNRERKPLHDIVKSVGESFES